QIVAFHDPSTLRITGEEHHVSERTLAELKHLSVGLWKDPQWEAERIPTLDEVLATVPPGKRLYVEIKCGQEILPELVRILKTPLATERVVVIGYGFDVLAKLKQQVTEVKTLLVVRLAQNPKNNHEATPSLAERIGPVQSAGLDGFDIGITELLTAETVETLLKKNFELCTWTINDPLEARRLELLGIHAITTDFPKQLRQELSHLGPIPNAIGPTPFPP
ncbi:MAG: glycerophosphodiester phosphodiesterase, partial [Planctomycetaceae bacterium]|nr:glycerophosphodiester phosphodiesterase [Planctomycetaceae bacterium]